MVRIPVEIKGYKPSYIHKWSEYYKLYGREWGMVIEMFHITTGGRMIGIKGAYRFELVFENDADATLFMLRCS